MNQQSDLYMVKRDSILTKLEQQQQQNNPAQPTKPALIIKISKDAMEATLLLQPTSLNTEPPTKEELRGALEKQGIVYGINTELLEDLSERPVFYHTFIIATGKPETTGADGYLNYLVSLTRDRIPHIDEEGIADFKNLGFFQIVRKGQPLCEIYLAQRGEDGMDVLGNVREGKFGSSPIDPMGRNTELSADGTKLLASLDGHVEIKLGVIHVIEVLTVENVDNSTGNIDFVGDVVIKGDVAPGFSIVASGSIDIRGNVESATLKAGTDIKVNAGMFGMDKGQIQAGGDIKCRFIQNCNVKATGNIVAESILYSTVECDGDIELVGRKAAFIGGRAVVSGKVLAKNIGSSKHVPTEIVVIMNEDEQIERLDRLRDQLLSVDEEISHIVGMINEYEEQKKSGTTKQLQALHVLRATNRYPELLKQRVELEEKCNKMEEALIQKVNDYCYVEARGEIHPNTKIRFGNQGYKVDTPYHHVRIHNTKDGISFSPL